MNPAAIELYREHGIDLAREPLEIAVCAQHNNGGLAANHWWESVNIRHLFPVGEVNGSHGDLSARRVRAELRAGGRLPRRGVHRPALRGHEPRRRRVRAGGGSRRPDRAAVERLRRARRTVARGARGVAAPDDPRRGAHPIGGGTRPGRGRGPRAVAAPGIVRVPGDRGGTPGGLDHPAALLRPSRVPGGDPVRREERGGEPWLVDGPGRRRNAGPRSRSARSGASRRRAPTSWRRSWRPRRRPTGRWRAPGFRGARCPRPIPGSRPPGRRSARGDLPLSRCQRKT